MFSNKIKVITLNVWHFEFMREVRAKRIGEEIARRDADVVILQEVPFEDMEKPLHSEFLNTIVNITGMTPVVLETYGVNNQDYRDGLVILAKDSLNVMESGWTKTPQTPNYEHRGVFAVFEQSGQAITVFNSHGAWGGHLSHLREAEVLLMNKHAIELEEKYKRYSPITLFGGDLNTNSDSASIRFLEGLQSLEGEGAFWVDSWKFLNPQNVNENTLSGDSKLFHLTAQKVGIIHSNFNPNRRLDYIFAKGWIYGRPGMPVSSTVCFTEEDESGYTVSDHYGLDMDFWLGEK